MAVLNTFEICNPSDPDIIQSYPDVVYNGENYMVVWSDEKFGVYYVTAGRVSPGGAVLDTGICISTGSGSYEYQPKITYDGNRCLVVWPKDLGIQARFVNNNGLPEGSVFAITANGSGPVSAFGAGNYLVAWFNGTYPSLDIKARLFSLSGVPLGSEITLTTDGDCNRWPDVVYDGRQYVIVWTKGVNNPAAQYVWAQAISTTGMLIGGNFLVSANTSDQRWFPSIASSDTNYLVAWGQSGANMNIMGNVDYGLVGIGEETGNAASATYFNITPNPFRTKTNIRIGQSAKSIGKDNEHRKEGKELQIYDISGRWIRSFTLGPMPYALCWNGTDQNGRSVPPGVYFVALDGGEVVKITIVR